jgi:acetoin utilization deacetylase AcuC-like enzyme
MAAAGTVLAATDAVLTEATPRAYALVRPPGHHAQKGQADGYCFFNHAALVADLARRSGADRVAVIDWDVHHGNGTQDVFYARDDVLTVSLHMNHGAWGPSHPQTGRPDELGTGRGEGHNVNVPLPLGAGDTAYVRALDEVVIPIVEAYAPDLIVCASGQDASAFDPNGRHNVTMQGFRTIGSRMRGLADRMTGGRLVAVQEGGYNPSYAAFCLLATLEGLENVPVESHTADPLAYVPDQSLGVDEALSGVRDTLRHHWPTLG